MRIDAKREGARQSMSWLHTWVGLLLGWLLYAVFLTGSLSFFQDEITLWMQPELHQSIDNQDRAKQLVVALNVLQQTAATAEGWEIQFPDARQPTLKISHIAAGEKSHRHQKAQPIFLDASTGQIIKPRETQGGRFLSIFHFQLYGIPSVWGRCIIGFATLFMLVALLSGIITHKKIFKEFFTFRRGKGQRSWLDAHNATAVFALPFYLIISLSGLLLLIYTLMPWAIKQHFPTGRSAFFQALTLEQMPHSQEGAGSVANAHQHEAIVKSRSTTATKTNTTTATKSNTTTATQTNTTTATKTNTTTATKTKTTNAETKTSTAKVVLSMSDIGAMLNVAQQQWPDHAVASISIRHPNRASAEVEIRALHSQNLIKIDAVPSLKFNAITGQRLPQQQSSTAVATGIYNFLTALHVASSVNSPLRILLFLSGILGTMMIATGLILWKVKRAAQIQKLGYTPLGQRSVEVLNVAVMAGLPLACGAYFYANRMIPAQFEQRSALEIKIFFIVWLLCLVHALIRSHRKAWLEQLALAAVLYVFMPVLNVFTGGRAVWSSIDAGQWMLASFDLLCIVLSVVFAYGYIQLKRHRGRSVKTQIGAA